MLTDLPVYISILFILTVASTFWLFQNSLKDVLSKSQTIKALFFLTLWIGIQSGFSLLGLYFTHTDVLPPRIFHFGLLPTAITIILMFATKSGKKIVDTLSLQKLTYISLVRIPVEIVLWCLFLNNAIPEIMTFEGWNFDIIAGITAPIVAFYGFKKKKLSNTILIAWNGVGLGLLTWIIIVSILASPFPLQQWAFDQPNVGMLYFPFSLLPTFVVPVVYFSHLASLRKLFQTNETLGN